MPVLIVILLAAHPDGVEAANHKDNVQTRQIDERHNRRRLKRRLIGRLHVCHNANDKRTRERSAQPDVSKTTPGCEPIALAHILHHHAAAPLTDQQTLGLASLCHDVDRARQIADEQDTGVVGACFNHTPDQSLHDHLIDALGRAALVGADGDPARSNDNLALAHAVACAFVNCQRLHEIVRVAANHLRRQEVIRRIGLTEAELIA